MHQPTLESNRIQSLDVLRGFALLGILLLNIIGFGLLSSAYSNPGFDVTSDINATLITWGTVELFAEGAMRGLFSILFGAGVLLFTTGEHGKSGWLHYKRTFWLLIFGLVDAYILLWAGDILINYAVAGALLFLIRNLPGRHLLIISATILIIMSGVHATIGAGLKIAFNAHQELVTTADPNSLPESTVELAAVWTDFLSDFEQSEADQLAEQHARTSDYASAFKWNAKQTNEMLSFVLPVFFIWDSLMMMTLGMALYKSGVLQGQRENSFYIKLMLAGFTVGLLTNGYEVQSAYSSNFNIFHTFAQMQPTYHIGRTGMALGYVGLVVWLTKIGFLPGLKARLASVGRMALTNYLMHSIICAIIFTGPGFGLLGKFSRPALYFFVFAIWILQLIYSHWWLQRYTFGPVEWLWRALTYGQRPQFTR